MNRGSNKIFSGMLVGIGNPLLDFSTQCPREFLTKHDLVEDSQVELELQRLDSLITDAQESFTLVHCPGGSVQNTVRILHWLLQERKVAVFIGCVGNDLYSQILENEVAESGVDVRYIYRPGSTTGICIGLVTGDKRTLCANIGAAAELESTSFLNDETYVKCLECSAFIYLESFLMTHSATTIKTLVQVYSHKCIILNLSAKYVCNNNYQDILFLLPFVTVVIGNQEEYKTFYSRLAPSCGQPSLPDYVVLREVLKRTSGASPPGVSRSGGDKLAVMTNGSRTVLLASSGSQEVVSFDVPHLDPSDIVDTTGAGDAFAAGFLSQFIQDNSYPQCVAHGMYSSYCLIKEKGCRLPSYPSDYSSYASVRNQ